MRVENPIDNFSVDYIRSNHGLVDRVWVLLPLADGHLEIQIVIEEKESFTKIAAWFHAFTHRLPVVIEHMLRRPDLHAAVGGRGRPEDHSASDKTLLDFLQLQLG